MLSVVWKVQSNACILFKQSNYFFDIDINIDVCNLQTKKHWNSFATDFFVPSSWVETCLQSSSSLHSMLPSRAVLEAKLAQAMRCHKCGHALPNMPAVKSHFYVCLQRRWSLFSTIIGTSIDILAWTRQPNVDYGCVICSIFLLAAYYRVCEVRLHGWRVSKVAWPSVVYRWLLKASVLVMGKVQMGSSYWSNLFSSTIGNWG